MIIAILAALLYVAGMIISATKNEAIGELTTLIGLFVFVIWLMTYGTRYVL